MTDALSGNSAEELHCRKDPRECRGESYCACQCSDCKAAHAADCAVYPSKPPPARELRPISWFNERGTEFSAWPSLVDRGRTPLGPMTTAHLAQCLTSLPAEERLRILRAGVDTLPYHYRSEWENALVVAEERAEQAEAKLTKTQALYHELILEVGTVFPGESRHQTARRFIREREPLNRIGECGTAAAESGKRTEEA